MLLPDGGRERAIGAYPHLVAQRDVRHEHGEKLDRCQLLIEEVTYNGKTGDVEITFRPGGVRALATDEKDSA